MFFRNESRASDDRAFSHLIPIIIGAAMLVQTLSATVVVNALPAMAVALHQDLISLNTTITIYMLALAVFLPVSGWAADRFGAKRVFLTAIIAYALASVACGLSESFTQLLVARAVQGAAAALMGPVGRLVLLRSAPKNELVRAMSVLTMPAMLGPVIGPPLGGFIVTYASWRWIFFLNVPVALIGVALVVRFIENVKEQEAAPLDWLGMVLTGVGMGAVVYGFENLGRGRVPAWAEVALLAGGAILLLLYAVHARRTPYAILDLRLFRVGTFFASVVGGTFIRMGLGAVPFLLALLLQVSFGMSAFQAGMMTFASAAAGLLMKATAPPILARFGFRRTLSVNAVIVGFSFMSYALLTKATPHYIMYAILFVGGFFRSLQFTALNGLAFADIGEAGMSRASTMSTMGQRLGQSIGLGLAASLLHLLQIQAGIPEVNASIISPVFLIVGGMAAASCFFFIRLPADAGAELHPDRKIDERQARNIPDLDSMAEGEPDALGVAPIYPRGSMPTSTNKKCEEA